LEQKRAQYSSQREHLSFKFVHDDNVSFTLVNPVGLKRVLSNLIDNSVDAMDSGTIVISLKQLGGHVHLSVIDTGKGIPADVLPKLGSKGFSYNKTNGSGLGLFHAIQSVEYWKGMLSIESWAGKGTTVTVRLPLTQKPSWFTDSFSICDDGYLVIVDDDDSIHERWHILLKEKLQNLPRVFSLRSPEDLKAWVNLNSQLVSKCTFLVDFNYLGSRDTGLELIEQLKIDSKSVLVSSQDPNTEMISKLQTEIWHYAKRQMTWFRADKRIRWFQLEEKDKIEKTVEEFLRK
jgi:anti-sigma regulatory factor (Ser/Thr protein kinase)